MTLQQKETRRFGVLLNAGFAMLLVTSSGFAQNKGGKPMSSCNEPAADPISYVSLPGHPFSTVASKDGCWLFVSVTSTNPKSANGVAMLSRAHGKITLKKVFSVEAGPTGMVMTHDGKLLIVADDDYVVFMDVASMTSGCGDPILGYISDGDLQTQLTNLYATRTTDKILYLRADEGIEYSRVQQALEIARKAGVRVVGAIAEQERSAQPARH